MPQETYITDPTSLGNMTMKFTIFNGIRRNSKHLLHVTGTAEGKENQEVPPKTPKQNYQVWRESDSLASNWSVQMGILASIVSLAMASKNAFSLKYSLFRCVELATRPGP